MRRYPHCKTTHRVAFYGVVGLVLLAGVASREMAIRDQGPVPAQPVISAL
jgi:hypothetical protein